ncbi:MAG: hypothetical protein ABIP44_13245 [Pseudoxanthomonas sp.]
MATCRTCALMVGPWPEAVLIYGNGGMDHSISFADDSCSLLRVLDDLAYVIECASLDYMGEGKFELDRLCGRIETDPGYRIADGEGVAHRLREALSLYATGGRDYPQGHSRLMSTSRELWKRMHPNPPA